MKEDPDIIREGFVVNDTDRMLLSADDAAVPLQLRNNEENMDRIEGNHLMVTDPNIQINDDNEIVNIDKGRNETLYL